MSVFSKNSQGDETDPALTRMFSPRSIALVGVSGRSGTTMGRPLKFLLEHGYKGALYPVNPKYNELEGLRCFKTLDDVPGPVDLVLVMVPAKAVADVVRQSGEAGAAGVIVFASGYSETGRAGSRMQAQLLETARKAGVRLLGPNCQGMVFAPSNLCATFTSAALRSLSAPHRGVAYVGQSGAIGGSIMDLANEMGVGLSAWVSTGNQVDMGLVEIACALIHQDTVRVLMLYVESVGSGGDYTMLARKAADLGKKLIVLRSGRSAAGKRATASHTGAMMSNDAGFSLVSRRYGAILVDDVDELLTIAACEASMAPMRGSRVAVITTSGGAGSLAADRCADHGLELPQLSKSTQTQLAELIPDFGAVANPVDVTAQILGSGDAFGEVCRISGEDERVDVILVLLTMVVGESANVLAQDLVAAAKTLGKPVLVAWLAGRDMTQDARTVLREAGMPVFNNIRSLARTASLLAPRQSYLFPTKPSHISSFRVRDCLNSHNFSGRALLDALEINHPPSHLVASEEQAQETVARLGQPAAMKIICDELYHKSDVGGVQLNVTTAKAAQAYRALITAITDHGLDRVVGVEVQPMVQSGVELIIGATSGNDGFPPVMTVGLGGVTTEIYTDTTSELAPVSTHQALAMLRSLKAWPLLSGFRGRAQADITAAADVIVRVSECICLVNNRIREFEINPLIVMPEGQGATAVDFLINFCENGDR